jgi:hypothetical protein
MYISEVVCHMKLHIEELEQNTAVHDHNRRQNLNIHVQFCRTNALKKGVMSMGIKLYNKLPSEIREVEKMRQCKIELSSYLIQHAFYFVDENVSF